MLTALVRGLGFVFWLVHSGEIDDKRFRYSRMVMSLKPVVMRQWRIHALCGRRADGPHGHGLSRPHPARPVGNDTTLPSRQSMTGRAGNPSSSHGCRAGIHSCNGV